MAFVLRLRQPIGDVRLLSLLGVGAVALFLGLFFSAQAGLLLLAAAWLAVGTWRAPWPALLLLVAVAPFLPILKATVVLGPLTLLKDIVILALFVRVLRTGPPASLDAKHPRVGGSWPRWELGIPVLALVAWAGFAFVRADATALGLLRLRDLLLYVPLFLVGARLVNTERRYHVFLGVFLGLALAVLTLAAAQRVWFADGMVLRFDPSRSMWIPRAAGVLAHPNILGAYLLFVLPLAAALLVVHGWGRRLRVPGVLLLLVTLLGTYATYSRGAWIATASSVVSFVALLGVARTPRLIGRVALLGLLVGASVIVLPRTRVLLVSALDPAYQSNKTRLEIVAGVLADISNVGAVVGEGLGDTARLLNRPVDISLYAIAAADAQGAQVAKARTFVDNAVLKTFIEQGTVGLVFAAWVAVRLVARCISVLRWDPIPVQKAVGLATATTTIGLACLWLFLDVPDIFPVNLYFWTFAGLIAGSTSSSAK